jgi:FtsH-binding integral membrane protein
MKHHLMIALGLLMAAVFSYRLANALLIPGIGGSELYLFGGVVIAALLIFLGLKERRHARAQAQGKEG